MAVERDQRQVTKCICGEGTVDETFWANDHPFATDYSWHSEGLSINCEACRKNWTVSEAVANPITPPAEKRVVHFVAKEEVKAAVVHNCAVDDQISAVEKEQRGLELRLEAKLLRLSKELLLLLEQDSRLDSKCAAAGDFLGIPTRADFRPKVGRTLPKTYIPRLIAERNMSEIFQRMGRVVDVEEIRTTKDAIVQ